MTDLNNYREEIIELLKGLKTDAEMAISGEWDVTSQEGIETGFTAQVELIDSLLDKIE